MVLGGLAAIALMPPLEFFTLYQEDINYRQQFFLAVLVVLCSLFAVQNRKSPFVRPILISTALIGSVSSLWGLTQSFALAESLGLVIQFGPGGVLTTLSFLLMVVVELVINKQGNHRLPCSD
jgi:disulfide bond formation protein DsbB